MTLSAEFAEAVTQFPSVLRELIEAELAAGNTIEELGHSFPAPPAGAYVKLANKVSTQSRSSRAGLSFYERNSSLYSGEFTDERRFYFVLEPANSPEPEPDMDAIRAALQPKPFVETERAPGSARAHAKSRNKPAPTKEAASPRAYFDRAQAPASQVALLSDESDSGWTRVLHFRDERAPYDLQFALERRLMCLFTQAVEDGKLCLRTTAIVVGAYYNFELRFEAALLQDNCYSLRVHVSWAPPSAANNEYYQKSSVGWFDSWTAEFKPANATDATLGVPSRYRQLTDETLKAEAALNSVTALQQHIVDAMKHGAAFRFADTEGSTDIFWRDGKFIRDDQGDYPKYQMFTDETEFLMALRQYCVMDITSRAGKNTPSDFDAWKLILRLLRQ